MNLLQEEVSILAKALKKDSTISITDLTIDLQKDVNEIIVLVENLTAKKLLVKSKLITTSNGIAMPCFDINKSRIDEVRQYIDRPSDLKTQDNHNEDKRYELIRELKPRYKDILRIIANQDVISANQIKYLLGERNNTSVNIKLKNLYDNKIVRRTGSGKRNHSYEYSLFFGADIEKIKDIIKTPVYDYLKNSSPTLVSTNISNNLAIAIKELFAIDTELQQELKKVARLEDKKEELKTYIRKSIDL